MSAPDLIGLVSVAIYQAHRKTPESFLLMAEAAIAAIHEHERTAAGRAPLVPPTLCYGCVRSQLPTGASTENP